jgi:hypothetical protein
LEADEGLHQHKEQLGEAEMGTTEGLAGENMSGEVVVEQQFGDEEPVGVETAAEWQVKATKGEGVLGSQCDFPIDKEQVQRASLQQKNQSIEKLDEVIKEIRKLMLELEEESVQHEEVG